MTMTNNDRMNSNICNSEHEPNEIISGNKNEIALADIIKNAMTKINSEQKARKANKKHKFPCIVCEKNCNVNQQSIYCTQCNNWVHRICNGTSKAEFDMLSEEDDDIPFHCILCAIQNNADNFPYGYLSSSELLDLYGIDLPSQLSLLPSYDVRSKLNKMPNMSDFDVDENLAHTIDSRYFEISDLSKMQCTDSFSLFHLNIRSLSSHHDELLLLLSSFGISLDVIGISESKEQTNHGFLTNVDISGYTMYSTPTKSSCGGAALYVKSLLNHKPREDLSVCKDEFEMVGVEILNSKSKNIICCCVYRHPNTDAQEFVNFLDNLLQNLGKENKQIFLMGDFNLNLLNYENHSDTNDFINTMVSHYLLPYILHPTRVTDHSSTVIDNIFSNTTEFDTKSGNILCDISDHFPQFLIVYRACPDYKSCSLSKHDFSNFDENQFVNDYSELDLTILNDDDVSVDDKFGAYYEKLSNLVEKHVPSKKMTRREIKLQSKPWINSEIIRLIKYRNKLKRRMIRRRTIENEYLYKRFRNRIANEIKASKKRYYHQFFSEHSGNMKMLWSGIRSIINIKKTALSGISQLVVDGNKITDPKEIASSLNKYFVSVPEQVDKDIPRTNKSPMDYLNHCVQNSFFLSPADPKEIESIILSFSNKKSVGPYSIPVRLLKTLACEISESFSLIVNDSFSTGNYPEKLKVGRVIALHKKGSTDNPSNYRPISLLSIFSKIFGKLMHKRLNDFLETNNVLHNLQFGFRKKHSTAHALISLTEKIKQTIDNGNLACGVFIDLKKAFDTVNHTILLKKLEHYGIRGVPLQWFKSYLTDRKQYVSVCGNISETLQIKCGVPQGSVLGPLLFLLYINDLAKVSEKLTFFLFADDTNIYYESSNISDIQKTVNKELNKVRKWLEANRLALNIDKTNFVIFHSPKNLYNDQITIKFGGKKVSQETCVKFLGVLLDSSLSWKPHITELTKKLSRTVGLFCKIRHYAPLETLKMLYHGIFFPFISYGIQVWGLTYPTYLEKVFILQKKIIKCMTFNDIRTPSSPLFHQLELLKLDDINNLEIASFVYECINGLVPQYFENFFTSLSSKHSLGTRQSKKGNLFLERQNTVQYGIRSIHYSGAKLWNSVPPEIRLLSTTKKFRSELKVYFIKFYI